ncbi:MAG: hypothetical protein ABI807_09045 [Sporichthyaceae bacterium]
MDERTVRARGLAAAAVLALGHVGATVALLWGTGGAVGAVRAPGPAGADALVTLAAAAGAWAVLTWLAASTLVALLTAAVSGLDSRAHDQALALAPAAARRLVGAVLGLTVAAAPFGGGLAPAASAQVGVVAAAAELPSADRPPAPPVAHATVGTGRLDRPAPTAPRGWTPDRPAAVRHVAPGRETAVRLVATTPHAEHAVVDEVVVRRGDSLWEIAARHLGADAGPAEVAAEWPRWYAANRAVIGGDPDLLRPGQRLAPPA